MRKLLNTLFVINEDAYLTLDGENLVVTRNKQETHRYALHTLEGIDVYKRQLVHRWLPDMVKSHWLLLLRDTIAACRMEEAEEMCIRDRAWEGQPKSVRVT